MEFNVTLFFRTALGNVHSPFFFLHLLHLFKWTWQESFLHSYFPCTWYASFSTRIHFKTAKKIMVCAIFLEKEVMCNQPLLSTIQNLWHTITICNIDGGWGVICSCHNVGGHTLWDCLITAIFFFLTYCVWWDSILNTWWCCKYE